MTMLRICLIAVALIACGGGGGGGDDGDGDGTAKLDGPPAGKDGPPGDGPTGGDAAITQGPACGAVTCTLGQQECCIGVNTVCKPAGTCPSQGFACDGPEDCPGGVCCYPNNNGSRCQTNNCQDVACHGDTDCGGAAPKCCPKPFTPSYKVCQAQC